MAADNGGPAFPTPATAKGKAVVTPESFPSQGMTLRDWFAGMAIQGVVTDRGVHNLDRGDATALAQSAYLMADAMLMERQGEDD